MIKFDIFLATLTFIIIAGPLLDLLVNKGYKIWLYSALETFWIWLDDVRIPDLPRSLAIRMHSFFQIKHRWRVLLIFGIAIVSSVSLTYLSIVAGNIDFLSSINLQNALTEMQKIGALPSDRDYSNPLTALGFTNRLLVKSIPYSIGWFAINLIFDTLTIAATLYIISLIAVKRTLYALPLILADVTVALALALGCVFVLLISAVPVDMQQVLGCEPTQEFCNESALSHSVRIIMYPFERLLGYPVKTSTRYLISDQSLGWFSATTLIPTVLFSAVLAAITLAWLVVKASYCVAKYTLERAIEDDPQDMKVFTLSSSWIALLMALLKWLNYVINS